MESVSPSNFFMTERLDQFDLAPQSNSPSLYSTLTSIPSNVFAPFFSLLFSSRAPLNVQAHGQKTLSLAPKVTVIGDVHGELFGLVENLRNAGLVNQNGSWIGKNETLVQLGDIIDRGLFSEESWLYLEALQEQAKEAGGQVIRILGNHELNVLQGHYGLAQFFLNNVSEFDHKLQRDILEKKVQLAYTDGKRLFVHAGLRSSLREQLICELAAKKNLPIDQLYIEDLVDYLNELLIEAVQNQDFSHAIFRAGRSRGGSYSQGGVLWADIEELLQSPHARELPQVAGHNPPRRRGEHPIRITDSQGFIEADAGMNAAYGARRAYVVFEHSNIHVRVKDLTQDIWMEQVAPDQVLLAQRKVCDLSKEEPLSTL